MSQTKLMLIASFIFLAFALILYYFASMLYNKHFVGIYPVNLSLHSFMTLFAILFLQLALMFVSFKFIPKKYLYEKAIRDLACENSLAFLLLIFLLNSLAEELIFRAILQENFGILLASVLFAAAHIAYYKKVFLLIFVFVQGLLLGLLYELTNSLFFCVLSHTVFNFLTVYLIKRKILIY